MSVVVPSINFKEMLIPAHYYTVITSLVVAGIFIYFVRNHYDNMVLTMAYVILTIIIYILIRSTTGSGLTQSLPYATYPTPPHLGLDGVTVDNRQAGLSLAQ